MNLGYMSPEEANSVDNLMPGNRNVMVGSRLKYLLDSIGVIGSMFYLDPANGADTNDGKSPSTAFKSLTKAYAALTANKNDVLFYIGNNGSINLTAAFSWDKDYCHLIGLESPIGIAGRARIFQDSATTGIGALFTVTATGCIVKNIYVFQGVNDATSLVAFRVTGQRNYFEGCHFAGIGNAAQDTTGAASLLIDGGAENKFVDCAIGLDTQDTRGANSTELWFKTAATRNKFVNCHIYAYISNAGHALVTVENGTAIDRFLMFSNCIFQTDSLNQAVTITSVFNIKSAITQGKIILQNPMLITDGASGSGAWDSNSRGIIFSNAIAPAATAAGGIATKK